MRRIRPAWIVAVVAIAAVVELAIVSFGAPAAGAMLAGTILVLFAPGYALVRALFPEGDLEQPALIVVAVGSSIAMTILTGVVLSIAGVRLDALTWLVALLAWTIGLGLVAWLRRPAAAVPPETAAPTSGRRLSGADLGLIGVAVLLAALALGVAQWGTTLAPGDPFAQLWLVPSGGGGVTIGLRSEETTPVQYRVVLQAGSHSLAEWTVEAQPGATWEQPFNVGGADRGGLQVLLYRADNPGQVYRSVELAPASPSPGPTASIR